MDIKRLREVLDSIAEEKVEFQVIEMDAEAEEIMAEDKEWLGIKFYMPRMESEWNFEAGNKLCID